MAPNQDSSLSFEVEKLYPSGRDVNIKFPRQWMENKQRDDNIGTGNVWRVHDDLYDLTDFKDRHPGGKVWLETTVGTDITEAFESAHIDIANARMILKKYRVGDCSHIKKNYPYTFHKDGFYDVVRSKALEVIKRVGNQTSNELLMLQNILLATAIGFFFLMSSMNSFKFAAASGTFLGMAMVISHNFIHTRPYWRIYIWDLTMFSSNDWRISHHLSHHLYTNTFNDYEITAFEPFLSFLPFPNKPFFHKYFSPIYSFFLYFCVGYVFYFTKVGVIAMGKEKLRPENVLPIVELAIVYYIRGPIWEATLLWLTLHAFASFWHIGIGVWAAHHHPDLYHAGDKIIHKDWGLAQLDATTDIAGKKEVFWLKMTTFGDHQLHHLFPTIHHCQLKHLYPVVQKTCEDFGIDFKLVEEKSVWEMFFGQFKMMVSSLTRDGLKM